MFLCHFIPLAFTDLRAKFYEDRPRGTLLRGLNTIGVAKYGDIQHREGYISETMQDTASDTTNDSSRRIRILQTILYNGDRFF